MSAAKFDQSISPVVDNSPILSTSSNIVVSPAGIIHVLGYTPTEGEAGAPISVRIHFHPDYAETIYVRLVVGHKAVATTVRELKDQVYGRWQLDAVAPPLDKHQSPSNRVLISVQALNEDNAILDSASFGEFSYWAPGSSSIDKEQLHLSGGSKKPKLHINTSGTKDASFRRRGTSHLPTPSPTSPDRPRISSNTSKPEIHLHRRTKADNLVRPKQGKLGSDIHAQTPILDLVTNLQSICAGWSPSEISAGRRLVRFSKVQDGRRLIVSCEPIKAEEYRDTDSVISCIYREESDSCFVTSVDIIFLLERLTSSDFPVEEKNRIRRNLEGLRPTTVSKHKSGFEDFFQRIMEFPDPKPRNIEKDLKVFEWSLLDQALDKILSKYTIDASSTPVETDSSEEPSPTSASDDMEYHPTYSVKMEDPLISTYTDPSSSTKFESIPDNLRFVPSSDGSESYCSPVDPTSATYQLYTSDIPNQQASGSSTGSWGSEYKPGDLGTLDHFAYDGVSGTAGAIGNYPALDYPFDGLAFHGMQSELGLVDNPYL